MCCMFQQLFVNRLQRSVFRHTLDLGWYFNILDVFFLYQEGMNFLKYNTFFSNKFIYLQKNKMFWLAKPYDTVSVYFSWWRMGTFWTLVRLEWLQLPSISYIDVYAKLNWLEIKSGYNILYYSDLNLY
jgi:hypothetical protein